MKTTDKMTKTNGKNNNFNVMNSLSIINNSFGIIMNSFNKLNGFDRMNEFNRMNEFDRISNSNRICNVINFDKLVGIRVCSLRGDFFLKRVIVEFNSDCNNNTRDVFESYFIFSKMIIWNIIRRALKIYFFKKSEFYQKIHVVTQEAY